MSNAFVLLLCFLTYAKNAFGSLKVRSATEGVVLARFPDDLLQVSSCSVGSAERTAHLLFLALVNSQGFWRARCKISFVIQGAQLLFL